MKRCSDVALSAVGLILLSPLLLTVALVVFISSRGPILYSASRVGLHGKPFKLLKFRTMVVGADLAGGFSTSLDDPRLTCVGRFLRKWKLDELPQLVNVLFGQMSLVGPRPQVKFYTELYSDLESQILSVRPGLTDLASLRFMDMDSYLGPGDVEAIYRSEVEPIKNALRLQYVRQRSASLDAKILLATLLQLFRVPLNLPLPPPSSEQG